MNFSHLVASLILLQGSLLCITAATDTVTCPPLRTVQNAAVHDNRCLTQRMPAYTCCRFKCPKGYIVSNGYQEFTRHCRVDGTWSGKDEVCKDREAPYFIKCPTDIMIESNNDYERVSWDSPLFKDNSGRVPYVTLNVPSGDRFRVPGKVQVMYVASDEVGNRNTSCKFEINLKKKSCPPQKPPKNGALACLSGHGGEKQCQVYCQQGFDFTFRPSVLYYCSHESWNSFPPFGSGTFPWPDCTTRMSSSSTRKMSASYYYSGNCNRADVQDGRKKAFISIASDPYRVPLSFCKLNPRCKSNNVNVFCGKSSR